MKVMRKMFERVLDRAKVAALVIAACVAPTLSFAGEVTFTAYDGTWDVTADLISYDDTIFRAQTELGVVILSARMVACHGADCPTPQRIWTDVRALVEENAARAALLADQTAEMAY